MREEAQDRDLDRIAAVLQDDADMILAYVFGSVPEGSAGPASDVDVAVLADRPLSSDHRLQLIRQLATVTGRPVDLIDLREAGLPLSRIILTEGHSLFCRDLRAKELLITKMLADVEDFLPQRQRLLKERRERWIR